MIRILEFIKEFFNNIKRGQMEKKLLRKKEEFLKLVRSNNTFFANPDIILKRGEKIAYSNKSTFLQERQRELKRIEKGIFTLTNNRFNFNGPRKNYHFNLSKINHLSYFSDAIEIGISGRQKVYVFTTNFPLLLKFLILNNLSPEKLSEDDQKSVKAEMLSKLVNYIAFLEIEGTVTATLLGDYIEIVKNIQKYSKELFNYYAQSGLRIKNKAYIDLFRKFDDFIKELKWYKKQAEIFDEKDKKNFDEWLIKQNKKPLKEIMINFEKDVTIFINDTSKSLKR